MSNRNLLVDPISGAPIQTREADGAAQKITDVVNSVVTYTGWSLRSSATESDVAWRIARTVRTGNTTKITHAGNAGFDHAWTERASLFAAGTFDNNYSTQFDGINDYVNFGASAHLYDTAQQWSLSCWVRPDNFASQRCIYSRVTDDANVYGVSFQVNTAGKVLVQFRASGQLQIYTWTASTALPALTWTHLTLTYNGGQNINGWRLYINGVNQATPTSAAISNTINYGQVAVLGARNVSSSFWSGYIDEAMIWGKALAASEVTALYNGGATIDPVNLSFYSDLANYYRMGDSDAHPTISDNKGSSPGTMTNMSAANFGGVVP